MSQPIDGTPPSPPPSAPAGWDRPHRGSRGVLAAAAAGIVAFLKYGVVLLKLGKLGGTFISMLVSVAILTALLGWKFAVGAVLLIFVHEMGHVLFARSVGVGASMPIFLGPFGAVIGVRDWRGPREEAIIAVGGPVIGTAGALLLLLLAPAVTGTLHVLVLALAYWGCLINLFNLVPVLPLDGGRVLGVLSRWFNVAGLAFVALMGLGFLGLRLTLNPFLVILLLLGGFELARRWRTRRAEGGLLSPGQRVAIFTAYCAAIGIALLGMSTAHQALIDSSVITPVG